MTEEKQDWLTMANDGLKNLLRLKWEILDIAERLCGVGLDKLANPLFDISKEVGEAQENIGKSISLSLNEQVKNSENATVGILKLALAGCLTAPKKEV